MNHSFCCASFFFDSQQFHSLCLNSYRHPRESTIPMTSAATFVFPLLHPSPSIKASIIQLFCWSRISATLDLNIYINLSMQTSLTSTLRIIHTSRSNADSLLYTISPTSISFDKKTISKLTSFHIRLQDLLTLHCCSSLHPSLSCIFISSTSIQGLFDTRTARLILLW